MIYSNTQAQQWVTGSKLFPIKITNPKPGENLPETQLETLVLPSLEFTIHDKKSAFQNETTIQNETETQTVENYLYLPIALNHKMY
ncbi:hypothetical protein CR513_42828, partial [Mucuna pruriens]